jgi:hypothetical protein
MSISVAVSASYNTLTLSEQFQAAATSPVSADGYKVQVVSTGTASSQISTATIGTLGYCYLRSLVTTTQTTCTITFGKLESNAIKPVVRLRPGDPALFRLAPGDYAVEAADEDYRLFVAVFED